MSAKCITSVLCMHCMCTAEHTYADNNAVITIQYCIDTELPARTVQFEHCANTVQRVPHCATKSMQFD
jgi:hypothetical protein